MIAKPRLASIRPHPPRRLIGAAAMTTVTVERVDRAVTCALCGRHLVLSVPAPMSTKDEAWLMREPFVCSPCSEPPIDLPLVNAMACGGGPYQSGSSIEEGVSWDD